MIQLSLDRNELLGLMQDSLESLAIKLGMLVASRRLEDEVTESQFRRVKGHRALPTLVKALEESTRARRSGIERGGA